MRVAMGGIAAIVLLCGGYLTLWPVDVDPVSWVPPEDLGYTGAHERNARLTAIKRVEVPDLNGPEDLARSPDGTLYTTSHEGWIARMPPGGAFTSWVKFDGRPLGIDWDDAGDRLVVADAFDGLFAVSRDGAITLLTNEVDGSPIEYADDVVAASDGTLYFSDASTKFGARRIGNTYEASLLDILEHGAHGRILVYDPTTKVTTTLLDGLQFANGVALSPDESVLYVSETGMYRVLQVPLTGPNRGTADVLVDNLPGYPDNLGIGATTGWLWVGMVSSRRPIVDQIAPSPFSRRVVHRLPRWTRPEANRYGHVFAMDASGEVTMDLQDPGGAYARTTGAFEVGDTLWITSLHEPDLGRIDGFTR